MNYVLMVGPRLLPTDGMIFKGSQYVLADANIVIDEYLGIDDTNITSIQPGHEPTHIIILGTPWVWDQCTASAKYANLQNLLNAYPEAKRLFLGVGSCLPLGKEDVISADIKKLPLTDTFKGSTIITRDRYATDILSEFNPMELPCPAFYALRDTPKPKRRNAVMIWYDPTSGVSKVDYDQSSADSLIHKYLEDFKYYYDLVRPDVYCVQPHEIGPAVRLGLPKPVLIQDIQHAALILNAATSVFSGRVHMAVPAFEALRDAVTLVAVDSRACTMQTPFDGDLSEYKRVLCNWY